MIMASWLEIQIKLILSYFATITGTTVNTFLCWCLKNNSIMLSSKDFTSFSTTPLIARVEKKNGYSAINPDLGCTPITVMLDMFQSLTLKEELVVFISVMYWLKLVSPPPPPPPPPPLRCNVLSYYSCMLIALYLTELAKRTVFITYQRKLP